MFIQTDYLSPLTVQTKSKSSQEKGCGNPENSFQSFLSAMQEGKDMETSKGGSLNESNPESGMQPSDLASLFNELEESGISAENLKKLLQSISKSISKDPAPADSLEGNPTEEQLDSAMIAELLQSLSEVLEKMKDGSNPDLKLGDPYPETKDGDEGDGKSHQFPGYYASMSLLDNHPFIPKESSDRVEKAGLINKLADFLSAFRKASFDPEAVNKSLQMDGSPAEAIDFIQSLLQKLTPNGNEQNLSSSPNQGQNSADLIAGNLMSVLEKIISPSVKDGRDSLENQGEAVQGEKVMDVLDKRGDILRGAYFKTFAADETESLERESVSDTPMMESGGIEDAEIDTLLKGIDPQRGQSAETLSLSVPLELQNPMGSDKAAKMKGFEQFAKDFENLLSNSSFIKGGSVKKLFIKLYPEHLGTLKIELSQTEGGLAAKILTSTQAAKDLLESQLHGLKQAFTQQNIDVSRIDLQSILQEERELLDHGGSQSSYQQSEKEQKKDDKTKSQDDASFEDILLNLKI